MSQLYENMARRFGERKAAEICGVSHRTLQDWRWRSTGPRYFKLGRRVVYDLEDLEAWMQGQAVEPIQ